MPLATAPPGGVAAALEHKRWTMIGEQRFQGGSGERLDWPRPGCDLDCMPLARSRRPMRHDPHRRSAPIGRQHVSGATPTAIAASCGVGPAANTSVSQLAEAHFVDHSTVRL